MPGMLSGVKFQAHVFVWVRNMQFRRTSPSCIQQVTPPPPPAWWLTQSNSNNSLEWGSFKKRNNLEGEERSMIQISFRTQDPNIKTGTILNSRSTVFSKSTNPLGLPQKSTIRALFKAKSVDPKSYLPPPLCTQPRPIITSYTALDNGKSSKIVAFLAYL